MKFGQLILRKIIKIVDTKCEILRHQNRFRLGELTALPRLSCWNKGTYFASKKRGGVREGKERIEEDSEREE